MRRIPISSLMAKGLKALVLALGLSAAHSALAQSSAPPVRILVGFPAGGGVDVVARLLAEALGQKLGQPFVVDNRTGAGGLIAAAALKHAAADGQTVFLSNDHTVVTALLTTKAPGFEPSSDFVPIGNVAQIAMGLAVHPSTQSMRLDEFAAWAKRNPSKANVGVPAPASIPEFAVSLLSGQLSIDAKAVAYRGGAPLAADLVSGQLPAGITALSELLQYQKAGKIRVLAVSGTQRSPLLPEVPTFAEQGVQGLDQSNFLVLFARAGTSAKVVERYSDALRAVLAGPALREQLQALGMQPDYAGPEAVRRNMQRATDNWGQVVKQIGFQPQ